MRRYTIHTDYNILLLPEQPKDNRNGTNDLSHLEETLEGTCVMWNEYMINCYFLCRKQTTTHSIRNCRTSRVSQTNIASKHERIITLEPDIKHRFILFNPANIAYNNQVKDYNKGAKHDDAPDSLYGAVQLAQGVWGMRFFERRLLFYDKKGKNSYD